MSAPSTAINRFDLGMSFGEYNLAASRLGFIGLKALPPIGVAIEKASFSRISKEELIRPVEDTRRTAKGTYTRGDFEFTEDSYDCKEHGVEEEIDDATLERYRDVIRAEMIHRNRAVHRMLAPLEQDIADAVFNTTTWTGSALTTAAIAAWTTPGSAQPQNDIENAKLKVKASCGMKANTLIMTDYALSYFKRTAEIQDLLKYSGHDDPKSLGVMSVLMELFDLEQILIADSFTNASSEGQSATFSRYWDQTMAMVCRVFDDGMDGDLEDPNPQVGRTVFPTDDSPLPGADDGEGSLTIEEYREENRRGGVLRARNKRHVKILYAQAGHLITGVTA